MPVDTQHPQYDKSASRWRLVRDCSEGSDKVKSAGVKYLPKPNPEDISSENADRYSAYIDRASYVNFTGMTLEGLLGLVFKNPITVEVQQAIEYLKDNIDGSGITLDQMTRKLIANVLQVARNGLLVDYPEAPEGLTAAQVAAYQLRANVLSYAAENIINWNTTKIGAVNKLSLVVLCEPTKVYEADGFAYDERKYHRVLRLADYDYMAMLAGEGNEPDPFSGYIYIQELYDEKNHLKAVSVPRKADKSNWDEIPFVFVGAQNNDPDVDKAPLYDMANVNIAHYRNSADFEESSFMVGQPTPVLTGLSQSWVDKVMKGGVIFGSRRAILLPEGGSSDLLQASENTAPERGMAEKEKQMVGLGARIIQEQKGTETAEAAKIRFAGQNSKLGVIVGNVEAAYLQCFQWAMEFMGATGENSISINKQFYDKTIDPQLVMAQIQLLDRGIIAKADLRDSLRGGGMIDSQRTDEQIDGEAEEGLMM